MKQFGLALVLLGSLAAALVGCQNTKTVKAECATCATGKSGKQPTWCYDCGAGYVDEKKIGCKGCYVAKVWGRTCEACASK